MIDLNIKLPGTLVPRATSATAVTASRSPTVQPKWDAKSPITAVNNPIPMIENTKQSHPSIKSVRRAEKYILGINTLQEQILI